MSNYNQDDQELYAKLSKLSFVRGKRDRAKFMNDFGLDDDWEIDQQLTDNKNSVIRNKKTGEIVLSVRGTEINKDAATGVEDLINDGLLFFGVEKVGSRFKSSERKLKAIQKKYEKDPVIVGTSLGGRIGSDLAAKYDLEGHIYNPGSSPLDAVDNLLHPGGVNKTINDAIHNKTSKIHTYQVGTDIISASNIFAGHENTHLISRKRGASNPHSIDNFIGDFGERQNIRHIGSVHANLVHFPRTQNRQPLPVRDVRDLVIENNRNQPPQPQPPSSPVSGATPILPGINPPPVGVPPIPPVGVPPVSIRPIRLPHTAPPIPIVSFPMGGSVR